MIININARKIEVLVLVRQTILVYCQVEWGSLWSYKGFQVPYLIKKSNIKDDRQKTKAEQGNGTKNWCPLKVLINEQILSMVFKKLHDWTLVPNSVKIKMLVFIETLQNKQSWMTCKINNNQRCNSTLYTGTVCTHP